MNYYIIYKNGICKILIQEYGTEMKIYYLKLNCIDLLIL